MKRLALTLLISVALGSAAGVAQQSAQTTQQARDEGNSFGKATRAGADKPTNGMENQVPGYAGTNLPQTGYFSNPEQLTTDGAIAAQGNETFDTVIDKQGTRAQFTNNELIDTTKRATAVEQDPNSYLGGESLGGSQGTCKPLPPGAGQKGYYEATCNQGSKPEERQESCTSRIETEVKNTEEFKYLVVPSNAYGTPLTRQSQVDPLVASGQCRASGASYGGCTAHDMFGFARNKFCGDFTAREYICKADFPEMATFSPSKTGYSWYAKQGTKTVDVHRTTTCGALDGDPNCTAQGAEVCTEGPETRVIEGVSVTQSCWAWSKPFTCQRIVKASDCSTLDADPKCKFLRDECLDDPQSGACQVNQRVYSCPLPDAPASGQSEYICGNDVYCMNGNCEPIEREASTEFKDALVALNALGQAGKEFDPDKLTVFTGERDTCSKQIFGASNCCSGKGVPLLTPWLCSSAEKELDKKDDKGLCYKVGSYCASKILGVCITSRDAYCCFGSKLSRILQVQGRPQINKPWGSPKDEQCKGFTIEEFQRLDLSKMDFSEVYAEFTEAVKLPDEVQTMTDIQKKIQDYYDLNTGK
ncbi:conjugal transfer protein TraN [Sphingomonas sp. ABOLE]|uniref:conjugal transfer protein TraN n=1 Tax=Sphingomonas sp. ABOLE TaxID=1985878 RepID=UPI000F7ED38F|nr:conjugal transfer protein TraN [Sphingomonas sp. ABOLE]RSV34671.1 conjugal transfer protein TraN [Sphingomonas sp. ABOLE]